MRAYLELSRHEVVDDWIDGGVEVDQQVANQSRFVEYFVDPFRYIGDTNGDIHQVLKSQQKYFRLFLK